MGASDFSKSLSEIFENKKRPDSSEPSHCHREKAPIFGNKKEPRQ